MKGYGPALQLAGVPSHRYSVGIFQVVARLGAIDA